jgi:hypothetical protein
MSTSIFRTARARYASLTRSRSADDPELVASRQLMLEQGLIDAIACAIESGPPITKQLRGRIEALLFGRQDAA